MTDSPFSLSRDQIREVDRIAVERFGVPSIVLMENAGRGAADVLCALGIAGPVVLACGKGNNAGDAFVVARHLILRGYSATVMLWCDAAELAGDAAVNYRVLERIGAPIETATSLSEAAVTDRLASAAWLVDGLLGTGARGQPRSPVDAAIDAINGSGRPVLSLDLPSGLDCETGEPASRTVRARHTCTFVAAKRGFFTPGAEAYVGRLHVLDIGVPRGTNNWGLGPC